MIRLGIAGDWHGNRRWALHGVRTFADAGISEIYHLGDFGIWPGRRGREYLLDLEASLAANAMTMFITPGNHEDYDQIAEIPALDLGHDIGEVQWITDHVALLPRGHRWERNGWTFVSLGGAASIDRWSRRAGIDWWEAEMITSEDIARIVEGGPADVMLAHDGPEPPYSTPRAAEVIRTNPGGFPPQGLQYAAMGHRLLTSAFLAVQPRLLLHGHFHIKDEARVDHFDHPTRVVALDCDGAANGNLLVVSLPARDCGEESAVEWLSLSAASG